MENDCDDCLFFHEKKKQKKIKVFFSVLGNNIMKKKSFSFDVVFFSFFTRCYWICTARTYSHAYEKR